MKSCLVTEGSMISFLLWDLLARIVGEFRSNLLMVLPGYRLFLILFSYPTSITGRILDYRWMMVFYCDFHCLVIDKDPCFFNLGLLAFLARYDFKEINGFLSGSSNHGCNYSICSLLLRL
jgi:hypothetical protein